MPNQDQFNIKLTRVDNGVVAEFTGFDTQMTKVYQDKSEAEESREFYVELFYDILDHFGDPNQKYGNDRIEIKYEEQEQE